MHFCSVFGSWIFCKWNVDNFRVLRLTNFIFCNCNHLFANALFWLVFPAQGWAHRPRQCDRLSPVPHASAAACPCTDLRHTEDPPAAACCPLPAHASGQAGLCGSGRQWCTDRCLLCFDSAHRSCGMMSATSSSTTKQHSLDSHISVTQCPAHVPPKAHLPERCSSSGAARVPQGRLYNLACQKFNPEAISSCV